MVKNWNEYAADSAATFANLGKANHELIKAVRSIENAGSKGVLDEKTKELIALAVAATTRCDGCIAAHASRAVKAGATRDELVEALAVAISLNTGAATVYSSHILEAYDQMIK